MIAGSVQKLSRSGCYQPQPTITEPEPADDLVDRPD
jgi:hypothetical protein